MHFQISMTSFETHLKIFFFWKNLWIIYKTYNNKLNSIKRKAEREQFITQLEINKSDMKNLGRS